MNRTIEGVPSARCYAPQCSPDNHEEIVSLLPEELALPDLIDLQGLEQEQEAAARGVSRKTVWRDMYATRRTITDPLIHGKAIGIGGCLRRQKGICRRRNVTVCRKEAGTDSTTLAGSAGDQVPDNAGAEQSPCSGKETVPAMIFLRTRRGTAGYP